MKYINLTLAMIWVSGICLAQPSLSIWITPDGYHQNHDHPGMQAYFCDSSYYLFYHTNTDTLHITLKNEGSETLDLTGLTTQSFAGASFEVFDSTPQHILPGEMYVAKLIYQLPPSYVNGINGQLTMVSNDPEKTNCVLYFDVGCSADWETTVGDAMGVEGSCQSPVIWIKDFNRLSDPNMVYDDSMNFYTYEEGFQSIKTLKLDHKGGVLIPNYLNVYERLEAGSKKGDFSNLKVDSNLVLVRKELHVNGNVTIGDSLYAKKDVFIDRSLRVSQHVYVGGTLEVEALTSPSDRRKKMGVLPIHNGLQKIMMLQPKSYLMKDSQMSHQRQFGFVAQELETAIPEVVYTDQDTMKSVNYVQLIPWLTAALQEQQQTIAKLEKRIVELEAR